MVPAVSGTNRLGEAGVTFHRHRDCAKEGVLQGSMKLLMKQDMRSPDTIKDFGEQWTNYPENRGYYASLEALTDLISPLMDLSSIKGKRIADVGAGTGRHTRLLHRAGADSILAMEPSSAFEMLKRNTAGLDRVEYRQAPADKISIHRFDLVFCIGVLQFIPEPHPALVAMGRALRPGGRLFLWVYGKENNELYLRLVQPLRVVTVRLPHRGLDLLSKLFEVPAGWYAGACRSLCLPMADYMNNYFSRLDRYGRRLVIYDQLNPRLVKYYRGDELLQMLETCGFTDIRLHHRFGHSWSVLARYQGDESPSPAESPGSST